MAPKRLIISHPSRLAMERLYLQGKSIASIAREFEVSEDSLRNHVQNHLSRQLVKAYEQKELSGSMNLLAEIDEIILKAKEIFRRNYDKGRDVTALKALDSQRSTIELLCKISAYMHQTKLLELQEQEKSHQQEEKEDFANRLKLLTTAELKMLYKLQSKLQLKDETIIVIPDDSKEYANILADTAMAR